MTFEIAQMYENWKSKIEIDMYNSKMKIENCT